MKTEDDFHSCWRAKHHQQLLFLVSAHSSGDAASKCKSSHMHYDQHSHNCQCKWMTDSSAGATPARLVHVPAMKYDQIYLGHLLPTLRYSSDALATAISPPLQIVYSDS